MKASKIKHLVRTISANPSPAVGTDSSADVEHELAMYFDGGWELFHTQVIGMQGANVSILYVLVKTEPEMVVEALMEEKPKRGRPAQATE
jgi:hypothetical protein